MAFLAAAVCAIGSSIERKLDRLFEEARRPLTPAGDDEILIELRRISSELDSIRWAIKPAVPNSESMWSASYASVPEKPE